MAPLFCGVTGMGILKRVCHLLAKNEQKSGKCSVCSDIYTGSGRLFTFMRINIQVSTHLFRFNTTQAEFLLKMVLASTDLEAHSLEYQTN